MKNYKNLKYPPIEQAIIAVVIESQQQFEVLDTISKTLETTYPVKHQLKRQSVFVDVAESNVRSQNWQDGYALFSEDRKKEVNINLSSVAFKDADKYENFEHLTNQYADIWKEYLQGTTPEKLNRVGLRYVNSFFMTPEEIDTNLLIKPVINSIGTDDNLLLSSLFGQYGVRSDLYRASGNIFIVINPQVDNNTLQNTLQVTFDIDVFDENIPYVDFASIKDTLNRLRYFKNKLFFDNIVDAEIRFNKEGS